MRIAVLGATGMAGSAIVAEALDRGHHVTALSRHPRAVAGIDRWLPSHEAFWMPLNSTALVYSSSEVRHRCAPRAIPTDS